MDFNPLRDVTAVGVNFFMGVAGLMVLIIPGRLQPEAARKLGFGRHVEALLLLSIITTLRLGGIGNVPVYIDEDGVVAFSLLGAIIPVLLSIHFLIRAGPLRGTAALAGIAATALVAYLVSRPEPEVGIISEYPDYLLIPLTAGIAGFLIAPMSLRAVPIAYACGSLGGLIGADLVRFEWVLSATSTASSFGGADSRDMVFIAGVWAAAFAAAPLVKYWGQLRRDGGPWKRVSDLAARGQAHAALVEGVRLVNESLDRWAKRRGLVGHPWVEIRARSYAEPVLARAEQALWAGPALLGLSTVKPILENLEGLYRRLERPHVPNPARPGKRAAAGAIDLLIPLIAVIVAITLIAPIHVNRQEDETPRQAEAREIVMKTIFVVWVGIATHVLYPMLLEYATGGATLGKALLGLRVRRLDGSKARGWDIIVRNLGRLLDLSLLYIVTFAASAEGGRQRLGDYFAETVVVDARVQATSPPVTSTPNPMAMPANTGTFDMNRYPR